MDPNPIKPTALMWLQATTKIVCWVALPGLYFFMFLFHLSPLAGLLALVVGSASGAAWVMTNWKEFSPAGPRFQPVPRPMVWLYGAATLIIIMYALVFGLDPFRDKDAPENPLDLLLFLLLPVGAGLLTITSVIDSGGINPFIDLVNSTFFGSKTYKQVRSERGADSPPRQPQDQSSSRSG